MPSEIGGQENRLRALTGLSPDGRKRGRGLSLVEAKLWNRSDNLQNFIEGNWGLIGWELETARKIEDVRKALNAADRQQQQLIQVFTRITDARATAVDLRRRAKELKRFDKEQRAAAANQQRCEESLQKVTWA